MFIVRAQISNPLRSVTLNHATHVIEAARARPPEAEPKSPPNTTFRLRNRFCPHSVLSVPSRSPFFLATPTPPRYTDPVGKNRRIIITLPALILAGLLYLSLRPTEPTYQGKTLSQWLSKYNDAMQRMGLSFDPDVPEVANSTQAIKAIGTNGIPTRLRLLQSKDIKGSTQLESFVQRLGWKKFHITHAHEKRRLGALGFYVLGEDARSASPAVIHILETGSTETGLDVLICLDRIQPPKEIVLPVLTQKLNNSNRELSLRIAFWLICNYYEEAEKAGVYKLYPQLRLPSTTVK
jgi:hypothetical protein